MKLRRSLFLFFNLFSILSKLKKFFLFHSLILKFFVGQNYKKNFTKKSSWKGKENRSFNNNFIVDMRCKLINYHYFKVSAKGRNGKEENRSSYGFLCILFIDFKLHFTTPFSKETRQKNSFTV